MTATSTFARFCVATIFFISTITVFAQPLPVWYKNNVRIHQYLMNLQTRFPNNIHVDSIGHSQHDNLPIWMARISNNATIQQDKPRVLLVGQVHAEEVLGVELCLRLAAEICSTQTNIAPANYPAWRSNLEIYIIPSANPEGLQVVTDTLDNTYRKNKRWVWTESYGTQNYFHFIRGIGNDTDGVDLNRNYSLNWDRGDTFLQQATVSRPERFDYYRGSAPSSESETQTLMRLNQLLKPMFAIIYHSSRQGTSLPEFVFFPWEWQDNANSPIRGCPDHALSGAVASDVAAHMTREESGNFTASGYHTRNGEAGDWFYQATGCICMHIEIGPQTPNSIQPDSAIAWQILNHVIAGNYVLFNRCLNTTGTSITGIVRDSSTGLPVVGAEIRVRELYNRILEPRLTDAVGRYNRPIQSGIYSLEFRKYGYRTKVNSQIIVGDGNRYNLNVMLAPLTKDTVRVHVTDIYGTTLPTPGSFIVLQHSDKANDTLGTDVAGNLTTILPADTCIVLTFYPGYVVRVDTLIPNSNPYTFNILLAPTGLTIQEGFENGLSHWITNNTRWGTDNQSYSGTCSFADSPGGLWDCPDSAHCYASNTNTWAMWDTTFDLSNSSIVDASLTYWIKGALEPEHDSSWVEVITSSGTNWLPLAGTCRCKMKFDWELVAVSLRPYLSNRNVKLRWHLVSDSLINQDGIHIDDIEVRINQPLSAPENVLLPYEYRLGTPFPNPFNATLRIPYSVKLPGVVIFRIFDVTGRTLARLQTNASTAGKHNYIWDASKTLHGEPASGLYFIEMKAGQFQTMQKVMLLK